MEMGKLEKVFVNSSWHGRKLIRWAESVLQHVPLRAGQKVLDVGSGTGALTLHLAQYHGLQATGVDIDYEQIREARQKAEGMDNVRFLVNDAKQMQLADSTFDVIVTFKALHHIADWEKAISEMMRVLKPGGYFVFFDLVSPQWLPKVNLGEVGVITKDRLAEVVAQQELEVLHERRGGLFYQLVGRK